MSNQSGTEFNPQPARAASRKQPRRAISKNSTLRLHETPADKNSSTQENRVHYQQRFLRVLEGERQRIGRNIHDDLCQYLLAISLRSAALEHEILALGKADTSRREEQLSELIADARKIAGLAQESVGRARAIVRELAPILTEVGTSFGAMLKTATADLAEALKFTCAVKCDPTLVAPNPWIATQLCRIAQEALIILSKRTGAARLGVSVKTDQKKMVLSIREQPKRGGLTPQNWSETDAAFFHDLAALIGAEIETRMSEANGRMLICTLQKTQIT
jgi:signal transduction histidine kinase